GAGALGGVINLVSRRSTGPVNEVLLNQSTAGASDGVALLARSLPNHFSGTMLIGLHHQIARDFDRDTWIDLAGYSRGVVRPRAFSDDGHGNSGSATVGFTRESRIGGIENDGADPLVGAESIDTVRADAGVVI